MRKDYPYLNKSYIKKVGDGILVKKSSEFLQSLDKIVNQRQYVKITLLSWDEKPIKSIEGQVVSGSISKDGKSAVRVTGSLSCAIDGGKYNLQSLKMDYAVNKKIYIELGVKNDTEDWPQYPILWFPQGVFYIGSISMSSSVGSAISVSLTLQDKMAGLNGTIGGTIPSTTTFDTADTQLPSGEYVNEKVTIFQIIQELVNHFGGEDLNNILIEDVPLKIERVMRWTGDSDLYQLYYMNPDSTDSQNKELFFYDTDESTLKQYGDLQSPNNYTITKFVTGDDIGYIYDDLVWTGQELSAAPGDSVTSILDKIKTALGNYEYYYDVYGIFHFREIKNYLNTTQGKVVLEEMTKNHYLVETNESKSEFTFSDKENVTSLNIAPLYENIKNDFVVHGLKKSTTSEVSTDVFYHLVIDDKPEKKTIDGIDCYGAYDNALVYINDFEYGEETAASTEEESSTYTAYEIGFPKIMNSAQFQELDSGLIDVLYAVPQDSEDTPFLFYYWNGKGFAEIHYKAYYNTSITQSNDIFHNTKYYAKDWRTELYLKGAYAQINGLDAGYYWAELQAFWPQTYNLLYQCFQGELEDASIHHRTLTEGNYFLDFIDASSSALGKYSVNAIGRRTEVIQNDSINCLFEPEIPNVTIIDLGAEDEEKEAIKQEAINRLQPYSQVNSDIYNNLSTGGMHHAAFDEIKIALYLYTTYQTSVALTALPAFYLSPNTRVSLQDTRTGINGDFVINNISLTLGPGANMSVNCNEALEKI